MKRWVFVSLLVSVGIFFLNGHATAQPSEEQLNAFRPIKTIYLLVLQSYDEANDVSLPIERDAKRILEDGGLSVITDDTKDCDAILKIQLKGAALEERYEEKYREIVRLISRVQYSGASISGEISLEVPGVLNICRRSFGGQISPPHSIPFFAYGSPSSAPFYEALKESDFNKQMLEIVREIQKGTLSSPGKIGNTRIVELLLTELRDGDASIRRFSVEALGRMKEIQDERAVEALIAALRDETLDVRNAAVEAIGKIKSDRALFLLITNLKNNRDPNTRGCAAMVLGKIADSRSTEPLIIALNDEDWYVRKEAAKGLGKMKESRAIEPLIASFGDENEKRYIGRDAIEVLNKITGKDLGEDPKKWQEWWEKNKPK